MRTAIPQGCSMLDPPVFDVVESLYAAGRRQGRRLVKNVALTLRDKLLGRAISNGEDSERTNELSLAVSRGQGRLLYQVARSLGARRIVEVGTSFGVSTLHLAAAAKDNGGGVVVSAEIEPRKVARARENLERANLAGFVELREGDALEVLRDPGGSVDLVFLDSFPQLYIPVVEGLLPVLDAGSVILANTVYFPFRRSFREYIAYVNDPANGLLTTRLPGLRTDYSVRL